MRVKADQSFHRAQRWYFIGIQGVAVAGLARMMRERGVTVAGSDVEEEFAAQRPLEQAGVEVMSGFHAQQLLDWQPDVVIRGASWGDDHPEVQAAQAAGIPVFSEAELRGWLSRQRRTIAVAGVHGKSTTTALLACILTQAGRDPSYLVGAPAVAGLPGSGHWGRGEEFAVEGDEYATSRTDKTAKFLALNPWATVITSLEWEHVDVYPDVAAMEAAFAALVAKTRGPVVACTDWPAVRNVVAGAPRVISYGAKREAEYSVSDFHLTPSGSAFTVKRGGKVLTEFSSRLIGQHNALNATAALAVCLELGIDLPTFTAALASFRGLARRQQTSVADGIIWIDDYGHHPTEVARTLEAIRERYPTQKIWVVFQPHLASRTRAFLEQFAKSFAPANRVLVADLFASAREANDPQAAKDLAAAVARYHEAARASGSLQDSAAYLQQYLEPGDVVVTMGAGDVYKVHELAVRR